MRRIAPARAGGLSPGVLGGVAVVCFSLSLPATRLAVPAFGGTVVGLGRSVVAAALAALVLAFTRDAIPPRRYWHRIALVASGVVVGFPLFTSVALAHVTAAHSAVIVGILPAATAVLAVVRADERPSPAFWLACAAGLAAVLVFAAVQGAGRPQPADLLVLLAVALGGLGYAEGGALARELGGWRVISWALVLSLPLLAPALAVALTRQSIHAGPNAWAGFLYVGVVSSYVGFMPWYRALARGGVARISQIQLAQPVLTLGWAALLLHESVDAVTVAAALVVLATVAVSQMMRSRPAELPATARVEANRAPLHGDG